MSLKEIRKKIEEEKNPAQALILQRFFKTGKGDYGEGDVFYGIKIPVQRKIVKQFKDLSYDDLQILSSSKIHEERLIAALILVERFKRSDEQARKVIFNFYLKKQKRN